MVLFKPKSDQVTPLSLSSGLPNQREGQTPPVSGTALMPFAHPVPVTLALLFLQDARDLPASVLLYVLCPLPGMPFPHIPKWFPLLLPPRPFLAPLYKISPPSSLLASPTYFCPSCLLPSKTRRFAYYVSTLGGKLQRATIFVVLVLYCIPNTHLNGCHIHNGLSANIC